LIPAIREAYNQQIKKATENNQGERLENIQKQLAGLEGEEARLARLFVSGNISEEVYIQLRQEWIEKTRNLKSMLKELEIDARRYLDDLEVALVMINNLYVYYNRLEAKQRTKLLKNIFKKILVNVEGDIISFELHSPFKYLVSLISQVSSSENEEGSCSSWVLQGPCFKYFPLRS
jgi:hypothetical protein